MYKDSLKLSYTASDDKFLSLRPNNLLIWNSIEYGCNENYKKYQFGRISPNNIGLIEFKKGGE